MFPMLLEDDKENVRPKKCSFQGFSFSIVFQQRFAYTQWNPESRVTQYGIQRNGIQRNGILNPG
jgi:hypothetical protein